MAWNQLRGTINKFSNPWTHCGCSNKGDCTTNAVKSPATCEILPQHKKKENWGKSMFYFYFVFFLWFFLSSFFLISLFLIVFSVFFVSLVFFAKINFLCWSRSLKGSHIIGNHHMGIYPDPRKNRDILKGISPTLCGSINKEVGRKSMAVWWKEYGAGSKPMMINFSRMNIWTSIYQRFWGSRGTMRYHEVPGCHDP